MKQRLGRAGVGAVAITLAIRDGDHAGIEDRIRGDHA
jgi:hypothetical protein